MYAFAFLCVTIRGSHKASVKCWPHWLSLIRKKKKWKPRHRGSICFRPIIIYIYILGKRINYIQGETQIEQ